MHSTGAAWVILHSVGRGGILNSDILQGVILHIAGYNMHCAGVELCIVRGAFCIERGEGEFITVRGHSA